MRTQLWTESFRCSGQKTWSWFSAMAALTISMRSFSPDCECNSGFLRDQSRGRPACGQGCPLDQSGWMPELLRRSSGRMIVNNAPAFRQAFEDEWEPYLRLVVCAL